MFIQISGTTLPLPTKYNVLVSDLDSSDTTRNEAGELVRNRIRGGVYKIELAFIVRSTQVGQILSAIEPAQVDVTFWNPKTSANTTIKAYTGDRNVSLKAYDGVQSAADALWEISFNLVEY